MGAPVGSRWACVTRGTTAAGFATFVAALSHTLAGDAAPSTLGMPVAAAHAHSGAGSFAVAPWDLTILLSPMRHRGPPELAAA